MNRGFILIDVMVCLIICSMISMLCFYCIQASYNLNNIIDIKIMEIDHNLLLVGFYE